MPYLHSVSTIAILAPFCTIKPQAFQKQTLIFGEVFNRYFTASLISIDNSSLIAVSYLKRMLDDMRKKPLKFKKLDDFLREYNLMYEIYR